MSTFHSLLWLVAILGGSSYLINYWVTSKSYFFDHKTLENLASKYTGTQIQDSFDNLIEDLQKHYGSHIRKANKSDFFIVNAGGWMGQVCALHVSLTEYVLIFNTVQETRGHSGVYWVNITDYIITGWMEQWKAGSFGAENFTAGKTVFHPWYTSAGVHFGPRSWFLEYGRGFVPSAMFFASADAFSSTHDFGSWFKMVSAFARGTFQEIYLDVLELFE